MILATMTDGKADLAEALMLIAFIVFVVAAVLFWIIPAPPRTADAERRGPGLYGTRILRHLT